MTDFQERLDRQEAVDNLIKLLGDNKYEKGTERTAKERGFGDTNAGKMFANQALKGFVEKLDDHIFSQPVLTRSIIVKRLVIDRDEDSIEYTLDPMTIGRLVLRGMLRSMLRPQDRRITVTGVAFEIGDTVEHAIKEVMLDMDYRKKKAGKMDMLRRQGKLGDEAQIRLVMEQLAEEVEIDHINWSKKDKGSVGVALLELLYASNVYIDVSEVDDEEGDTTADLEEDNA